MRAMGSILIIVARSLFEFVFERCFGMKRGRLFELWEDRAPWRGGRNMGLLTNAASSGF